MKVKLLKADLLWNTWYPVNSIVEVSAVLGTFITQSGFAQIMADSETVTTPINPPG